MHARGKNYMTISWKHQCQTGLRPKHQMNLQWPCQKYRNTLDLTFRFLPKKVAFWRPWKWREYSFVHTSHLGPENSHLFSFCFSISLSVMSQLIGYSEKPVNLQMFIGTADDRYLRPHAFYQVHRITGKTVATASQEIIVSSTKVLEIPLLPENNMSAR